MLANMRINFIHYCSFTAEKTLALACAHVVPLLYDIILTQLGVPNVYCYTVQVRYLKIIEKSGYQALPWVRYITQNGDYQLRTQ